MADSKFKHFKISEIQYETLCSVYIAAIVSAIMSQVMRIEEACRDAAILVGREDICVIGQNMGRITA